MKPLALLVLAIVGGASACARAALPADESSTNDPSEDGGVGEPTCPCDRDESCAGNCVCDPDCEAATDGADRDGDAYEVEPEGDGDEEQGADEADAEADPQLDAEPDPDAGEEDLCLADCVADADCLGPCGEGNVCAQLPGVKVCMPRDLAEQMGW